MNAWLLVGCGGALGAISRHALSLQPLGVSKTLLVNVFGSFLLGLILVLVHDRRLMLLLTIGFCGAFTTFSAFSYDLLVLIQRGAWGQAFIHSLLNVVVSVFALWLGITLARLF